MKSVTAVAVVAGLASLLAGCYTYSTPRYAYAPAYTYYPSGPYYATAPTYPTGPYYSAGYYNPTPYERGSNYTGSDPWWHQRNYRGIHGYPE